MKFLDGRHFNDIEPYITGLSTRSVDVNSSNDELMIEINRAYENSAEFPITKLLIYDTFLKILYTLSKLHESYMMCENPNEVW